MYILTGSILIGVRAAFTRLAVTHSSILFAVHSCILISYQAAFQMAVDVQFQPSVPQTFADIKQSLFWNSPI